MAGEIYRIVEVQADDTEDVVADLVVTDDELEQAVRAEAFAAAFAARDDGLHVRVYSSDESGVIGPDEGPIWDSMVNT